MFEFNGTASYQLKQQARCITAVEGDTDHNKFVVCSLELREENELHVLEFNEDTNEVWCQRVYSHPNEVWECAACPAPEHAELFFTTHASGSQLKTTLWRLEGLDEPAPSAAFGGEGGGAPSAPPAVPLTEVLELPLTCGLGESRGVLWNAVLPEMVALLHARSLQLYTLAHGVSTSSATDGPQAPPAAADATFGCGRWDPHHAHSLGVSCERDLLIYDTRTMKRTHTVPDAHAQRVRSLDYNPNRPHVALSAGEDFSMRWWDLRKPASPLLVQRAHQHWATAAQFNRFHDQLVLSAGTDSLVKLWRASSISASPPSLDDDAEADETAPDALVETFDAHEQSVFGAAWSAADAWIFASLSLDGKCVINRVPPAEKYKILL